MECREYQGFVGCRWSLDDCYLETPHVQWRHDCPLSWSCSTAEMSRSVPACCGRSEDLPDYSNEMSCLMQARHAATAMWSEWFLY